MAVVNSSPAIGISNAVYALLNESTDVSGGTATYGTVKSFFPIAKCTVNPNGAVYTDFGDDAAVVSATTTGKIQVSLEILDIDPAAYAEVTGQTRANGIATDTGTDTAPYLAFGFRQLLANGSYRYVWLLKGKFAKSQEGGDTKKDSINYQHVTLAGEFVKLLSNNAQKTTIRTDATDVSATTVSNWFTAPVTSNSIDLGALTLTSAAGTISTKTFVLTFAKAGGGTTTIADASAANIVISVGSTGSQIALTTFTPGSASTTPTVSVVTSATLTGVPYTVCATAQLHDANGVPCVLKTVTCTPA